jgi:hypothetical protein
MCFTRQGGFEGENGKGFNLSREIIMLYKGCDIMNLEFNERAYQEYIQKREYPSNTVSGRTAYRLWMSLSRGRK